MEDANAQMRTLLRFALSVTLIRASLTCTQLPHQRASRMQELHNPRVELAKCGRRERGPPSSLCDPHKFICDSEADHIDRIADDIRAHTGCPCASCAGRKNPGYTFAVAVLPKILKGHESDEEKARIGKTWAQYYRNITNFGHCEEDVIIVWSVADHEVWAYSGATTEKHFLYRKCIDDILKQSEDFLCSVDPGKGVIRIMSEMRDVFMGVRCTFLDWPSVKIGLPTGVSFVLYALLLTYYLISNWCKRRTKWRGGPSAAKNREIIL